MNWKRMRTPAMVATAIVVTAGISGAVGASAAVHYAVLGATNSTTAATYINNSKGTPLALNSKAGSPPLAVGSTKAVTRLNADYVDGYHASSFAKVTGRTGVILTEDAPAVCPPGTVLTGGGGMAETSGALAYSGPQINDSGDIIGNAWEALDASGSAFSFAVCYNPTGTVPGSITASALAKVAAKAEKQRQLKGASITPGTTRPSPAAPSPSPSAP